MIIPVFSFIYLCIIGKIIISNDVAKYTFLKLLTLGSILDVLYLQGAFISNIDQLSCANITRFIIFIYSVYLTKIYKIRFPDKNFYIMAFFLMSSFVGIAYEVVDPYDGLVLTSMDWDSYASGVVSKEHIDINIGRTVGLYIKLVIYCFSGMVLKEILDREDVIYAISKIVIWTDVVVIYGLIEFFICNVLNDTNFIIDFKSMFFGVSDATRTSIEKRGEFFSLMGFTKEPSYFAICLYVKLWMTLLLYNMYAVTKTAHVFLNKYRIFMVIITIVELYMIGSFSVVWFYFMLMILGAALYTRRKKYSIREKCIISVSIVLVLCLMGWGMTFMLNDGTYIGNRLALGLEAWENIVTGYVWSFAILDSSTVRFMSIIEVAVDAFSRPFFGLGIGIQAAHDSVVTMLSDFGIVGMVLWFMAVTFQWRKKKYDKFVLFIFFFIGGLPVGYGRDYAFQLLYVLMIEALASEENKNVGA